MILSGAWDSGPLRRRHGCPPSLLSLSVLFDLEAELGRGEGHRFRGASEYEKKLAGLCLIRKFPRVPKNHGDCEGVVREKGHKSEMQTHDAKRSLRIQQVPFLPGLVQSSDTIM